MNKLVLGQWSANDQLANENTAHATWVEAFLLSVSDNCVQKRKSLRLQQKHAIVGSGLKTDSFSSVVGLHNEVVRKLHNNGEKWGCRIYCPLDSQNSVWNPPWISQCCVVSHLLLSFVEFIIAGLRSIILKDRLIQDFARNLILRSGGEELRRPNAFNPLRQKLRAVALLLSESRKTDRDIEDMDTLLSPKFFQPFLNASKTVATQNDQMGLTIGSYIKQLILLKISRAIQTNDMTKQTEAERFRYLMDAHFLSEVTSVAGKRQRLKRINRPEELPLSSDLADLSAYLKEQIMTTNDVNRLAKLCLCYLIVFNKRRPMEVAEITTEAYITEIQRPIEDNPEILNSLEFTERLMAER